MANLTIIVSSKNPVKVNAALRGFQKMFPHDVLIHKAVEVASGVADQPLTDEETLTGALQRVENAFSQHPDADYWIGIEGGISMAKDEICAFAWVVVKSKHKQGKARSGTFFLPKAVKNLLLEGVELGTANDIVFGHTNSKQQSGAAGILTGNVVDRTELYEQAVILALIPFKNEDLY